MSGVITPKWEFKHGNPFGFWCHKVLPLVYDDSLSYYEVLCRMRDYINNLIKSDTELAESIGELQDAVEEIQKWIDNYDESFVENIISKYLAKMNYVWISDAGYIVYYIPEGWEDIVFNTSGLDIEIEGREYGHLVLSLWSE